MKIAIIARCKNEMENLEEWLKNKSFCNLFLITDNESTDGSFEFLSNKSNVIVSPVTGFDEGRDFQILMNMARSHRVDWVFKFDCDEFVGDDFASQLNYVLNQTDFDCIRLRKISKHFTAPKNKCLLSREYHYGGVYGVRLSSRIEISDRKSHVGSFCFYKKSIILGSLVTHFWVRSQADAIERARIYSQVDKTKSYEVRDKVSFENFVDVKDAEKSQKFKRFDEYGVPFLLETNDRFEFIKPKFSKSFIIQLAKKILWPILCWIGLSRSYLNWARRKNRS
mgnify:FL=1